LREVIIAADAMTAATFTTAINKRCRTCAAESALPTSQSEGRGV
jgi:hypothetical protein